MKVTLDTTILVRAFLDTRGPAQRLLLQILETGHPLVLSNEILAETARVLRYPRLRDRHGMPEGRIYDYVMLLTSVATMVRPDPLLFAPIRDVNDIVVIQTAVAGGAEVICTTDEDFFAHPACEFLRSFGIRTMTDGELLAELRAQQSFLASE